MRRPFDVVGGFARSQLIVTQARELGARVVAIVDGFGLVARFG